LLERLGRVSNSIPFFIGVLALQLLMVLPGTDGPVFWDDELAYFANARHFAGIGPTPTLLRSFFYHPGFSLLITPVYLATSDPTVVYKATIIANCVLTAGLVFPMVHLGRALFGLEPRIVRWLASIAALYPGTLLISHFAFADSMLALGFLVLVVLAARATARPTLLTLCSLGVWSVITYLIHPRALPVIVVTVLYMAIITAVGEVSIVTAVGAFVLTVVSLMAVLVLNSSLVESLYPVPRDQLDLISRFFENPERLLRLLPTAAGQLWYLTVSSLLLVPLGIAGVWKHLRTEEVTWRIKSWSIRQNTSVTVFLVVATAAMFATSVLSMTSSSSRIDHAFYGRYNDAFAPIYVMVGLVSLRAAWGRRRVLLLASVVLVTWLMLDFGTPIREAIDRGADLCSPCVPGFTPFLSFDRVPHLAIVSLTLGVFVLVVAGLSRVSGGRTIVTILIPTLFLAGSWLGATRVFHPFRGSVAGLATLHHNVRDIAPNAISYDLGAATPFGIRFYQFWLPEMDFRLFEGGGALPTDLFISSKDWPHPQGARLVAAERNLDQALWVLPGSLERQLERQGLLAPADLCGPLPDPAYRADVSLLDDGPLVLAPGMSATIRVSVTHTGGGSPWLPLGASAADCAPTGVIRLGARWSGEGDSDAVLTAQLGELRQTMSPGTTAELSLMVTAAARGEPLEPGRYQLTVSLVHEGITWFDDQEPASKVVTPVLVTDS